MTRWRAVVFDLDDTLYPERDYVRSGFRAVAAWASTRLGTDPGSTYRQLWALSSRGARGTVFDRWLEERGAPARFIADMVRVYRGHRPTLRPFPGISRLLGDLKHHYRLGLLSDGHLDAQRAKLDALGVATYFDAVLLTDELTRSEWKPSERGFRLVLERLGTDPPAAVYVADNPVKDFLGARGVGMGTIWVRYSGGDYVQLTPPSPAHAAESVADTLDELRRYLLDGTSGARA